MYADVRVDAASVAGLAASLSGRSDLPLSAKRKLVRLAQPRRVRHGRAQ